MEIFVIAIIFTLGTSALCSVLEAMILSATTAELESFKKSHPRQGELLVYFNKQIETTSSAILTLNTIANTLGSIIIGALAQSLFGDAVIAIISGLMTIAILTFSEILPKNFGVRYRVKLFPIMTYPLLVIRIMMTPFSFLARLLVRAIMPVKEDSFIDGDEIRLLAEKSAQEGNLNHRERDIIHNTLRLDDVKVMDIMTPRTVVMALEKDSTLQEVFEEYVNLPFARVPVFSKQVDNIIGVVRRRDILSAKADGHDKLQIHALMDRNIPFIPETATASKALQTFLKKQQQLGVVVDEFGSMVGVLSMEDVIECVLGQEIFEKDDLAVDMREFARKHSKTGTNIADLANASHLKGKEG